MIYELIGNFQDSKLLFPYEVLWRPIYYQTLTYGFLFASVFILFLRSSLNFNFSNKFLSITNSYYLDLGIIISIFLLTFTLFFNQSDEVFVNLEHSYNLANYGLFSMSPAQKIDGTIEYLFYIIHYPFAKNLQSLIWGNYIISMLIGLGIIITIFSQSMKVRPLPRILFAITLAASPLLIAPGANGFGSGLTALFFLIGMISVVRGWKFCALITLFIIPLTRPDGIIWAYILCLSWIFSKLRSPNYNISIIYKEILLLAILPALALVIVFTANYFYYGNFIPTPISFKGGVLLGALKYLYQTNPKLLIKIALGLEGGGLRQYLPIFIYLSFSLVLLFGYSYSKFVEGKVFIIGVLFLSTPIAALYFISSNIVGFSGNVDNRYIFPFICAIFLSISISISHVDFDNLATNKIFLIPIFLLIFSILGLFERTDIFSKYPNQPGIWSSRHWSAFAGNVAEKIMEANNYTIGTSEMNTFGFVIKDRHVIDYWGYTNPKIAQSKICNGIRIKYNPYLFLEDKPDLFWPYGFTILSADNNYDTVEKGFGEVHQLGNIKDVFSYYDFVILNGGKWPVAFLVRHDHVSEVLAKLNLMGYKLNRKRPYDLEKLRRSVEKIPTVSFPC